MNKKAGRFSRKIIIISSIIALLAVASLGGGLYYLNVQQQQKRAGVDRQDIAVQTEREKLDEAAFRGDRDIAARYAEKVAANEPEAAYQLYTQEANKLTDTSEKIALYEQAVMIAYRTNRSDDAVRFSVTLSELNPDYRTFANLADLYDRQNDTVREKEYLQKAIDQLETFPQNSSEYKDLLPYYKSMLEKAEVK